MGDPEDLVEPGDPRAALVRRASREVGVVDRWRRRSPTPQPVKPGPAEELRARDEVQPGGVGDPVALALELDRKVGFASGDVRLEQVVTDVLRGTRAR